MTTAAQPHESRNAGVHVQVQGWTAQCPRCEARSFEPQRHDRFACKSCGASTPLSALLNQIACNARLSAEVLAGYAKLFARQAN